jgi:hypothetical protein
LPNPEVRFLTSTGREAHQRSTWLHESTNLSFKQSSVPLSSDSTYPESFPMHVTIGGQRAALKFREPTNDFSSKMRTFILFIEYYPLLQREAHIAD